MTEAERAPRQWASRAHRSGTALAARARAQVRARTDSNTLGGKVILNSGWLIAERLIRMVVAFAVNIWMIRYLGPDDYGVLAYALSVILLVDVVANLGMRSVVVRELVQEPNSEAEIIGTTVGAKVLTTLLAGAVIIGVGLSTARGSDALPILIILTLSLPFTALASLDLAFQASLQSQYAVVARTVALVLTSVLRIGLLIAGAPLIAFAIAAAFELAAIGFSFAGMYLWKRGRLLAMRFRPRLAWRLTVMSWPFLLSALAASVYLKIDQVMLHAFSSSSEVGQYAAAARLSEVWYFIPVAMASSLLPMLVVRLREDPEAYRANLQRALDVTAWMAISLSVGITLVAIPVVSILYGEEYPDTGNILRIHTWAAPFLFMGTVLGRALIAEDMRRFEMARHAGGALLNVALNFVLIPALGGMGAAIATVTSYAAASYFACFFYPPARMHLRLMTRALFWPVRSLGGSSSSGDRGGPGDGGSDGGGRSGDDSPPDPPPSSTPGLPPARRHRGEEDGNGMHAWPEAAPGTRAGDRPGQKSSV